MTENREPLNIKFPKDVEDFIDDLCAKAIVRAIKNGAYRGQVKP